MNFFYVQFCHVRAGGGGWGGKDFYKRIPITLHGDKNF